MTYQAEVGLRNAGGGWVLVARSNQARLPRPVGIDIPAWDGVEPEVPAQLDRHVQSPVAPSGQVAAVPEPSPNTASGLGLDPAALPALGTRPARWVVAAAAAGLPAEIAGPATAPSNKT